MDLQSKKYSSLKNLWYIFFVFLLAYLPLHTFLFALKNDMFIGYLPPRFLMSEAIHSGQLPLWNPYISYGLPFYGDMSSSYWSPLTWIIASTSGYNAYSLTIEVLIYLFVSGIGMYYLAGRFSKNNYICLIAAVSYMCNGYIIGHLQHINWLSGAAFLPWCMWALEKMHSERSLRSLIIASLFFYLLASSSHPGIIIGAAYLFFAYTIVKLIAAFKQDGKTGVTKTIKLYFLLSGFLVLISAGFIIGYADIIPYFDRNQAVDMTLSLNQNTNLKSWISALFPFATTKGDHFFQNDPAFRNIYFGITLFLLFLVSLFKIKSKQQVFFLTTGAFFMLLSLGGILKPILVKFIPLIGYVRVNAEFRIFAFICFVIAAVIFFDRFIAEKDRYLNTITTFARFLIAIITITFLFSLVTILTGNESVIWHIKALNESFFSRDSIKQFLDQLSLYDTLFIQSIIQIILLALLIKAYRHGHLKKVFIITAIDIVLATLLNLPFTGVGKVPVSTISTILKKSPAGIPTPTLQPVKENDTIPLNEYKLVGDWSFYSKQPGSAKPALYPVKLINNYHYYYEAAKDSSTGMTDLPFIYITNSIAVKKPEKIKDIVQKNIVSYKTGELHLNIPADTASFAVIQQNFYPHWYYKTKGNVYPVQQAGINFIGIPLKKGENEITVFFDPKPVKAGMIFSVIILLLFVTILFFPKLSRFTFKAL